jgi:hypothetical protein
MNNKHIQQLVAKAILEEVHSNTELPSLEKIKVRTQLMSYRVTMMRLYKYDKYLS